MVVFYEFKKNAIKLVTNKHLTQGDHLRAYTEVYDYLTTRGYKPRLHTQDNETPKEVELFIEKQREKYQYTAPQMHRTNNAEKVVQTWKNNFKAGLASLPKYFPITNWCQLT